MNIRTTSTFVREYSRLPPDIRTRADKQISLLLSSPRHPSLRIKKMSGHRDLWEARVTRHHRVIFQIIDETFFLLRIGSHDILKNP